MLKEIINQVIQAVPNHVRVWITGHLLLFRVFGFLLSFILGGIICQGIGQGVIFRLWDTGVWPWLIGNSLVPNLLITGLGLGWVVTIVTTPVLCLIYVTNRRWAGERDTARQERETCTQNLNQTNTQVGQLTKEVERLRTHLQTVEAKALDLIVLTDRELFFLVEQEKIGEKAKESFYDHAYARLKEIFRASSASSSADPQFRASIYTRDGDYLRIIEWKDGVGTDSLAKNIWYVGDKDPDVIGAHRGTAGHVFMSGQSLRCDNVLTDPECQKWFYNIWGADRDLTQIPYGPLLQVLICHPSDENKKYGVLSLDSRTYVFTERDQYLAEQVAMRFGLLMDALEARRIETEKLMTKGGDAV